MQYSHLHVNTHTAWVNSLGYNLSRPQVHLITMRTGMRSRYNNLLRGNSNPNGCSNTVN